MKNCAVALILSMLAAPLLAAPWISPSDLHLRADLQRLADEGFITVPLTTFPLMWAGIQDNIQSNSDADLSDGGLESLRRVRHRMTVETGKGFIGSASFGAGTDTPRFQHFGSDNREQGETQLSAEYMGDRFAGKLAVTYAFDAQDDEDFRLDGSYVAAVWGNWVFSAGQIEQWYGPGMDTSLLMSTNARPMPGLHLTRNNPKAFESKWLSWIGPWTLTTGVSWMNDDEREVQDTLLYTFRATIKPIPQLELGVSRAAQLCGDGYSCSASVWGDMLTGKDNTGRDGIDADNEPGNQIASIDARWGDTLYGVPYGLYVESMGEDGFGLDKFPPFQAKSYLWGADVSYELLGQQIRTFFEYSDTAAWCNDRYDCAYEHHRYKSGMRYNGRVIGSTYDNDTFAYVLGNIGFAPNGHQWKLNLRFLDINHDNSNSSAPGGNPVSDVAEETYQLEAGYIMPLGEGRLSVTAEVSRSTFKDDIDSDTDANLWASWEIKF
ncbi:capsule assembly Wzi family protein [Ferrimonas lipolytica]|uniref:Capsule assembly Wzi family protein n=1 Tax=Ferrimonas lipolytica TaxID=2724191 RepID=A0A6H1UFA5_9GAMM|nr:capsule assembly Wzi family protein [Ferrimonas lipolytica]QIZ77309.1 capsule assembly Wzi family protein [Ferrimonas lipolytica]